MKITERYASAVNSTNLKSRPDTTYSDTDVLGAFGKAGVKHPLATALTRLFSGDNHAVREIVAILADDVWRRARLVEVKLTRVQSEDMARAVLAWHRDGVCRPCSGHGYLRINGAPTISDAECPACRGTRKVPFERQFHADRRELARWLQAQIEREQAEAGQAAMRALAPRLDF